jgi:hypothetical protein
MAASRRASPRPLLAVVWLALAVGCGRSMLYGEFSRESDDLDGEGGEGADSSGGTRAGRTGGGRNGAGGDTTGAGATGPSTGGTSTGTGGDGSGATGPNTGGSSTGATGGIATGGAANGGTSSGDTSTGGSVSAGNGNGGVANSSGVGASAGQGGNQQAGKGGEAGEPNNPDVPCGDTICDVTETCCVGLTETACLPDGSACNGAVLNCSSPGYCAAEGGGEFCCLTMGGGMATAECSDDCSNSFDGSGRLRLRLCESDDDCTPNRECRMTFVGVNACMRRL